MPAPRSPRPATPSKPPPQQPGPATAIINGLQALYPEAHCELVFASPFQLLVATILSAQSTDKMVNAITPGLFTRFPDAAALAAADPAEVERLVARTGFFRQKAKNIVGSARLITTVHGGEVPRTMEALCTLPGVARKTANVVLGSAYGMNEGIAVDTHVTRLAGRLGLSRHTDPVKIERDLVGLFPRERWTQLGHQIIWHGRRVCQARKPACQSCTLAPHCPAAGRV
ncbi:MAG: endonuclease III [Myxococcales bacterium]|nr:endonuclease III [Myxococcales bacterium]